MLPMRLKRFRKKERKNHLKDTENKKQQKGDLIYCSMASKGQFLSALIKEVISSHVRNTLVIVFHEMKYSADFLSAYARDFLTSTKENVLGHHISAKVIANNCSKKKETKKVLCHFERFSFD